jgi:hypothetical protein
LALALGALVGPAGGPSALLVAWNTVALAGHDIALHALVVLGVSGHASIGAAQQVLVGVFTLLEEVFVLCDERTGKVAHVILSLGGNDPGGESEGSDDAGELHDCNRK